MTTDDDRIAYLAGDGSGVLDDVDPSRTLDALKGFLSDPAMWAEPAGEACQDGVVAAIVAEMALTGSRAEADVPTSINRARWHRRLALGAVAAAAAILVGQPSGRARRWQPVRDAGGGSRPDRSRARRERRGDLHTDRFGVAHRAGPRPGCPDSTMVASTRRGSRATTTSSLRSGTFNEGEDVVLWAGVSPVDFPTMTITEETADGDPSSSGQRVLVGPIGRGLSARPSSAVCRGLAGAHGAAITERHPGQTVVMALVETSRSRAAHVRGGRRGLWWVTTPIAAMWSPPHRRSSCSCPASVPATVQRAPRLGTATLVGLGLLVGPAIYIALALVQ